MNRILLILALIVVVLVMVGCDGLGKLPFHQPDLPTVSDVAPALMDDAQGKGRRLAGASASGGGATLPGVLRWGGTILILAGLAIVAARFLGFLTAPLIGGVLTVGTGIATLTLAEMLGRHWWIGPLILLGLVGLAVIEYLNERDLLWRDPPRQAAGHSLQA